MLTGSGVCLHDTKPKGRFRASCKRQLTVITSDPETSQTQKASRTDKELKQVQQVGNDTFKVLVLVPTKMM